MVSTSALVAGLLVGTAASASAVGGAMVDAAACTASSIPANDDASSAQVDVGFDLDFFGTTYSQLYVNNNGNVTFDGPLSTFTPFQLSATREKIIAPFFADVDTRGAGSGLTRYGYGATVYEGHPAFCATWKDVGYYRASDDRLDSFQLLLVDRSDVSPGAFDIVMNFDTIQWETGDASGGVGGLGGSSARVGYSNGVDRSFELPGSGTNGAFLDSNAVTGLVHGSRNSTVPGRYVFEVRGGDAATGHQVSGTVTNTSADPDVAVPGAYVSACAPSGECSLTTTGDAGQYTLGGLADGTYRVSVSAPGELSPAGADVTVTGADVVQDFGLVGPVAPPVGTTITPTTSESGQVPTVFWTDDLQLRTQACPGGTGSYTITGDGFTRAGTLTEGPPGVYTATVPAFFPDHGNAHVSTTVTCPGGGGTEVTDFDLYIDPSGVVVDTTGAPVAGATVTLMRSNVAAGPFTAVPDGSAVMSPGNRTNPDTTTVAGGFGWDVLVGFYVVRAEKAGCHAPGDAGQPYVESAVMQIPPPVTDLNLVLDCTGGTAGGGGTPVETGPTVDRISGADRYATSAAVSAASFTTGVSRAYIATGDAFPDALTGAAVAGGQRSPVLLVRPDAIPATVAAELQRLKPKQIVVLGGASAVSTSVEEALAAYTEGTVTREAGLDRYETAAMLSQHTFVAPVDNVFVATGLSYPDALSAAAAAGAEGVPVLLVQTGAVPDATKAELTRLSPKKITLLGGTAAVSDDVATALKGFAPTVERWSGSDRYATSVVISSKAFPTATRALIATGEGFADALAGAAVAAGVPGPMLLSTPGCVPADVAAELARLGATRVTLLGGTSALGTAVGSLTVCSR
jgi:putative cell wall-binding protein